MSQSQQSVQQQRQPATESQGSTGQQSESLTAPVGTQYPTRNYLPENVRSTSIGVLNQCLADLSAVNMQLKHAHWNVKGIEFYQLHELFEDLVDDFEPHIDAVAERASALGGQPMGTAAAVAQQSSVPRLSHTAADGQSLVDELAYNISVLDATLYRQIELASQQGDLDTADLLNEVSRDVSKALWFLEAHLQSPQQGTGAASAQQGAAGTQQ